MNRRPVQVINEAVDALKRDEALLLSEPVDEADLPGDESRERDRRAIRRPARDHGTAAEPARAATRAWHDVQPRLLSAPGPEHQLGTVGRPAEPACFRRAEHLDGVSSVHILHHDLAVRRMGRDVRDPAAVRRQGRGGLLSGERDLSVDGRARDNNMAASGAAAQDKKQDDAQGENRGCRDSRRSRREDAKATAARLTVRWIGRDSRVNAVLLNRWHPVGPQPDRGHEAIAPFRHGLDESLAGRFPEGLPEHRYRPIEVRFLDEGVAPDLLQQTVFFDQVSGAFHQDAQEIEDLRSQRNRLAATSQTVLVEVQTEPAELIDGC